MNNLEWMYRNDKSFRDFCQWTLKEHPFTFGMVFETREDAGEWLMAPHVDDESCRQDADQPKRQESPDYESDSREKLEADMRVLLGWVADSAVAWGDADAAVRYFIADAIRILNRQAAIDRKEFETILEEIQECMRNGSR